ncbi:G-rich sequence factor 1 [Chlorella sorokiniana]|uniref:G-rich sequence factor 1 n=1 Tax=Chlorella sorokiniana TaxID=3076 RepID=A0A2P6TBT7_CHLSO|nr:G-rich sequence factor 1 [Chlorella sorokiniana]|eukprot:PRW18353.1 G-rich sequence factor 1 [Chlorella sorokiniana]
MASLSTLLRLRGLPFSCTEEEVLGFFEGSGKAVAVHLSTKNGKRSGEGYAEFETPEDAQKALAEKQHAHLSTRYIELFVAGEADLLAATSGGEGARPTLRGHVVRLRGLPFNSTAQDVLAFFEGVETVGGEAGIVFTCTPDGRPTGEAYVALAGPEAQAAALARHKEKIGARYIEIFESSRGDMYQAVQQHGYFTTVGGRRRHHWHQAQHAGGGGYPPDAGGGGGGGRSGAAMGVEDMTNAFAGFGLSQRDMQVPGPPRWGAYGAPADQRYQQYGGMQAAGVMPQGQMRWRTSGQLPQAPAGMRSGGMQHFNPAPGPPPGKGGRSSMPNGTRAGGGMVGMPHEAYGGSGHGAAMVFHPFMVPPLMMQHQQQHASPWGTPAMMQQQSGAWYGGMGMGRAAMHGGQMAGMGGHTAYTAYPSHGYYAMRTPGMPQQGGYQQHSGSGRHVPSAASTAPAASQASAAAPPPPATEPTTAAVERANSPQDAQPPPPPAGGSSTGGASSGSSRPGSAGSEVEASAAAASPATPEQ